MINQNFWASDNWKKIQNLKIFPFFRKIYHISLLSKHILLSAFFLPYLSLCHKLSLFHNKHKQDNLIISLTSYPKRIKYVFYTICSLLNQTTIPNKIILVLSIDEFPQKEKDLPKNLMKINKEILEILWVKGNIKSYKKYFYTMQSYPDCICITVDDDIIYQRNTIANLLNCYKKNPTSISALCTNKLLVQKGEILNYSNAIQCYDNEICIPRFDLVAIGFAGILYPPSILPQESFNLKLIQKCAPLADDLWLKFTELLNHTPVACAAKYKDPIIMIPSQDTALNKINQTQNDIQMQNILKEFQNADFINIINKKCP